MTNFILGFLLAVCLYNVNISISPVVSAIFDDHGRVLVKSGDRTAYIIEFERACTTVDPRGVRIIPARLP